MARVVAVVAADVDLGEDLAGDELGQEEEQEAPVLDREGEGAADEAEFGVGDGPCRSCAAC